MNALHTRVRLKPRALSRKLVKLERTGRYEEALRLLSDGETPGTLPDVTGLARQDAAELLLRFGVLVGFDGHSRGISGSQGRSKDILTAALDTFAASGDMVRVAECENFIALAYWRTGEHREAEVWVEQALARDISPTGDVRLYSHVVRSLILLSLRRHEENVVYCRSNEETFRLHGDAFLNGSLFANLGISLKDLGRTSEALAYLDLAKAFHERSGHKHYLGTASNNLALLYKDVGRFHMAHFSVDKAIAVYKKIGDKAREGSSLETKAQVYLAEKKLDRAMDTIGRSIQLLRRTENKDYLAESIMSRARIFVAQDNFADAILSLIEAVEIVRETAGEADARRLIAEFKNELDASKTAPPARKNRQLELALPPSLHGRSDYKGVWIHNSHLDGYGVGQNSLALVVDEPLERGQPAALLHIESGEVSCGFYDSDFGIVALEGSGTEPQLFDQGSVKVLGRIVGVCENADDGDSANVRPLNIFRNTDSSIS